MKTIENRVEFLRKHNGLSYNKLASVIGGITADGVRKSLTKGVLKPIYVERLCNNYGWSKNWVLTGDENKPIIIDKANVAPESPEDLKDFMVNVNRRLRLIEEEQRELRGDFTKLMMNILTNIKDKN